jgi:hypothetical protein
MVDFVVELRPEQLEMIAGEDTVSISRPQLVSSDLLFGHGGREGGPRRK